MEKTTSPEIIVLTLAATAAGIYAFWLSIRQDRRFDRLIKWVKTHHSERWRALPWVSRRLNLVGGVEHLRRQGLADDPEFMAHYREGRRGGARQIIFILVGSALIGVIPLGVRYLGWQW